MAKEKKSNGPDQDKKAAARRALLQEKIEAGLTREQAEAVVKDQEAHDAVLAAQE